MRPMVLLNLLSRSSSTVSTTLILVFATFVAGFLTPTVKLRLPLRGGARILADRLALAAAVRLSRQWPPGEGGMIVRGRGAPGVSGGAICCLIASSGRGGVQARWRLFLSVQSILEAW